MTFTPACDMYAVGVAVGEMLGKEESESEEESKEEHEEEEHEEESKQETTGITLFHSSLTKPDPSQRLTAQQALHHPFLID